MWKCTCLKKLLNFTKHAKSLPDIYDVDGCEDEDDDDDDDIWYDGRISSTYPF